MAAFHQSLPPLPAGWHPHKELDAWALESCDETSIHPGRPGWLTAERLATFRTRLQQMLNELHQWREHRQTSGMVRECHGDLHLGNVVQWQGQMLAFDAIEFDTDLRCIDVMNDAAFTFMDLQARNLPGLAWRFINTYVEHTGDFDGLRGLNLFAAYRALVRAKVALLSDSPPNVFARYWDLAERIMNPPRRPRLLVTMGLSGSGKSTVAQQLVEALAQQGVGTVRVRSDVERKRLHGLSSTERPANPQALYAPEATERTYAHLQRIASELLHAGHWVVVDAASLKQDERSVLRAASTQAQNGIAWVECVASPEHLRARIREREWRNQDASDATLQVLERQMISVEPLTDDETATYHRITNNGSLDELHAQVNRLAQQLSATP